jgi:hypothetical protein
VCESTSAPVVEVVASPDLYFFGDHEHGFECPDDMEIVAGRKFGERFTLKAAWYADREFEVTKVPDDTSDDYAVREIASPQPPAQAAAALDVESMLRACVPGGDICDPQRIADAIREWFDDHGTQAAAPADARDVLADAPAAKVPSLTDEQKIALAAKHGIGPTSGLGFANALLQGGDHA